MLALKCTQPFILTMAYIPIKMHLALCVCMVSLTMPHIPIEIHLALYVVKTLMLMVYILIKVHMAYCVWLSVGYGLHSCWNAPSILSSNWKLNYYLHSNQNVPNLLCSHQNVFGPKYHFECFLWNTYQNSLCLLNNENFVSLQFNKDAHN